MPPLTNRTWLHQFLRWIIPLNSFFGVTLLLAAVRFNDRATGATALVLLGGSVVLLVAWRNVRRDHLSAAVHWIAIAMFSAALAVAHLQPWMMAVLLLIPLLAVSLALPYVTPRPHLRLSWAAGLTTVAIYLLAGQSQRATPLSLLFQKVFLISALVATLGLTLLLLWQYSSRLRGLLRTTQAAEARYQRAAQGANDGLWDWNLLSGEVYYSPRWVRMIGYQEGDIGTTIDAWLALIHEEDRPRVRAELDVHLSGLTPHFVSEYRIRCSDGRYRWMQARGMGVADEQGTVTEVAGSQTDIMGRKQYEAELRRAAHHDSLTGLPNRTAFMEALAQSVLQQHRDPSYTFAVLFLDLDHFKVVNDSLGHGAGDELLVAVGHRLRGSLRPEDQLARLGGDEFTILLPRVRSLRDAVYVAERIQNALAKPFDLAGTEIFTSACIGITWGKGEVRQPEELLREADSALYHAKAAGKMRWSLFDHDMYDQAVARLQLETDLRRALAQDEFHVFYQPIVSLRTGELYGVEALVRWQHPARGWIPPDQFLAVAEEAGLMATLDAWVLRTASRQVAAWQRAQRSLVLCVNMSGPSFSHAEWVEQVRRAAALLAPESLHLELTEGVVMAHPAAAARLTAARQHGVKVSIDDFGTGYSSLARLDQLPVDSVKVDRLFMKRVSTTEDVEPLIESVIALARSLKLDMIAEGIESKAQLDYLRARGCPLGQGYLFAPALDATDLSAFWAKPLPWAEHFLCCPLPRQTIPSSPSGGP